MIYKKLCYCFKMKGEVMFIPLWLIIVAFVVGSIASFIIGFGIGVFSIFTMVNRANIQDLKTE